ncbi:AP2 domain transcription factor AP2III-2 [Toxoplasma gondii MAS]|uniref:AP2 domain transcription factor AP2III-2 n=2 Tax=Toxoplasma gondii TaxID=5811 RepID=A0A086QQN6_TOXGO|nr:AP2 domain transcription factor AP2III-2 [Toxoplasma gondii MAS]PUA89077.1 AP2 domain transcription factor AP2III-2 [Toxoplasma gondii TgCATBr9]
MINLHQLFRVFSRVSSSASDPSASNPSPASLVSVPALQTLSFPALQQQDLLASLAAASLPGPDSVTMSSSPTSVLNSSFCSLPSSRKPAPLPFPATSPKTPHLSDSFPASAISGPSSPGLQELLASPELAAAALASLQKQQLRLALGTERGGCGARGDEHLHSILLQHKATSENAMRWSWHAGRDGAQELDTVPETFDLPLSLSSFLGVTPQQPSSLPRSSLLPPTDFSLTDGTLRVSSSMLPALATGSESGSSRGLNSAQASPSFSSLRGPPVSVPEEEVSGSLEGSPGPFSSGHPPAAPSHPCSTVSGADTQEAEPPLLTLVAVNTPDAQDPAMDGVSLCASKEGMRTSSADLGDSLLAPPGHGSAAPLPGRHLGSDATRTTTTTGSGAPESPSLPLARGDCEGAERGLALLEAPVKGFNLAASQSVLGGFAADTRGEAGEKGIAPQSRKARKPGTVVETAGAPEAVRRGRAACNGEAETTGLETAPQQVSTSEETAKSGRELACARAGMDEEEDAAFPSHVVSEFRGPPEISNVFNDLDCSSAVERPQGCLQHAAVQPFLPAVAPEVRPSATTAGRTPMGLWSEAGRVSNLETDTAEIGRRLDGESSGSPDLWGDARLSSPDSVPSSADAPVPSHPQCQEQVPQVDPDSSHPLFASCSAGSSSTAGSASALAGLASPFPPPKSPKTGANDPRMTPSEGEMRAVSGAPPSLHMSPPIPPLALQDSFGECTASSLAGVDAPEATAGGLAEGVATGGGSDSVGEGLLPGAASLELPSSPSALLSGAPASLLLLLRNGQSGAAALVAAMQQRQALSGDAEEALEAVLAGGSNVGDMANSSRGSETVGDGTRGSAHTTHAAHSSGRNAVGACPAPDREGETVAVPTSVLTNNPASTSKTMPSVYSTPASAGLSLTSSSTPPVLPTPNPGAGMPPLASAHAASPAVPGDANLQSLFFWAPQACPLQPGALAVDASASSCGGVGSCNGGPAPPGPSPVAELLDASGSGPFGAAGSGAQLAAGPFGAATPASATFQQQLLLLSAAFDQIGSSSFPVVGGENFIGYSALSAARPDASDLSASGGPPASLPVLLAAANAGVGPGAAGVGDQPDFLALLGGGSASREGARDPVGGELGGAGNSATSMKGVKRQFVQNGHGTASQTRPEEITQGPGRSAAVVGRATKKQRRGPPHSGAAVSSGAPSGVLAVPGCLGPPSVAKGPGSDEFNLQQLQQSRDSRHSADNASGIPNWPPVFSNGNHTLGVGTRPPSPSVCSISHDAGFFGASGSNHPGSLSTPVCLPQLPGAASASEGPCEAQQTPPGSVPEATTLGGLSAASGNPNSTFSVSAGGGVAPAILNLSSASRTSSQTSPCCPTAPGSLLSGGSGPALFFAGPPSPLQKAPVYAGGSGSVCASSGDAIAAAALLHLRTLQQLQELQRHFQRPGGLPPAVTPACLPSGVAGCSPAGLGASTPGTHSVVCNSSASPVPGASRVPRRPDGRGTGGAGGDPGPSKRGSVSVSSSAQQFVLLQLKQQQPGSHGNALSLGTQGNSSNPAPAGGAGAPQQHHPGVCYSPPKDVWRARITVDGRQHEQQFSVKRHGFEEARLLAVQWRAHMENLRLGGAAKGKGNASASSASAATATSQGSSQSSHQPPSGSLMVSGNSGMSGPGAGPLANRGL